MKIRVSWTYDEIHKWLIFLPIPLIFFSEYLSFRTQPLDSIIKTGTFAYMLFFIFLSSKFDIKLLLLFIPVLGILIFRTVFSFNIYAALEELLRYFFPIIILFYSFTVRKHFVFLFKGFLVMVFANIIFQFYNYTEWLFTGEVDWLKGTTGLSPVPIISGILKAVGFVGFAAAFGFMNFVAVVLTYSLYEGKNKKMLIAIFSLFTLLSLSYKIIGILLIFYFFMSKNLLKYFTRTIIIVLFLSLFFPILYSGLYQQLLKRIDLYITEGNSARAESYRVMFENMKEGNFFGKGIGSFGGPASIKYNSPLYDEYNFNWYEMPFIKTTDTYFPHPFVEIGIIGALLYLLLLCTPLLTQINDNKKRNALIFTYLGLFFDSLFSFGMNAPSYLIVSLLFTYPIIYYDGTPIKKIFRE